MDDTNESPQRDESHSAGPAPGATGPTHGATGPTDAATGSGDPSATWWAHPTQETPAQGTPAHDPSTGYGAYGPTPGASSGWYPPPPPGYGWSGWQAAPGPAPASSDPAHRPSRWHRLGPAGIAWVVVAALVLTVAGLSAALATTSTGPTSLGASSPSTTPTSLPGANGTTPTSPSGPSGGTGSTGSSGSTGSTGSTGTGSTGSTGAGPGSNGASAGVDASAVAATVDPALVDISTTLTSGDGAEGTGMVLTSSGLVLTNNHVIENATSVVAQVDGAGRTYQATVLGYSVTDDVALLQLQGASGLTTVTTGVAKDLTVGRSVVVIGNALGKGGTPSAVAGSITALDQTITAGDPGETSETLHDMIELDADVQPGDSGGAVVDTSGQVLGMTTAADASSGAGLGTSSGTDQGYAIPITDALSLVQQIEAGQDTATVHVGPRALLGVEVTDGGSGTFGSSTTGAYVDQVEAGTAAAAAGITAGDTIVSVNGTTVSSASDLGNALADDSPGQSVVVGWIDTGGAAHSATVQLTTGPPA